MATGPTENFEASSNPLKPKYREPPSLSIMYYKRLAPVPLPAPTPFLHQLPTGPELSAARHKLKLERLGRAGLIEIDDAMVVRKEGFILLEGHSVPKKLNMWAYVTGIAPNGMPQVSLEPGLHQVSVVVAGPKDILALMESADLAFKNLETIRAPWAAVELIRRGVPLGTLDHLRERYNRTLP